MMMLVKIILSIPIGIGLVYPFIQANAAGGILNEIRFLGFYGSILFIALFLLLVLFYIFDLIKTLKLVSPSARKAQPKSVWLMFLLPYNFIEDFFIVANVARSLKAEAAINPSLASFKSFGMVSGLGWCIAQIISLIPHPLGSVAGLVAMSLWGWHWAFIRRVNKVLIVSNSQVQHR